MKARTLTLCASLHALAPPVGQRSVRFYSVFRGRRLVCTKSHPSGSEIPTAKRKSFIDFAREVGDGWGTGMGGLARHLHKTRGGEFNSQRDGKRLAHRCVR